MNANGQRARLRYLVRICRRFPCHPQPHCSTCFARPFRDIGTSSRRCSRGQRPQYTPCTESAAKAAESRCERRDLESARGADKNAYSGRVRRRLVLVGRSSLRQATQAAGAVRYPPRLCGHLGSQSPDTLRAGLAARRGSTGTRAARWARLLVWLACWDSDEGACCRVTALPVIERDTAQAIAAVTFNEVRDGE